MAMAEQKQHQQKVPSASSASSSGNKQPVEAVVKGLSSSFPEMSSQQSKDTANFSPRRPTAEEMIEYYVRKGLDKQAATEKVIYDLQKALTIAVSRYPKKAQEVEKSVRSVSGTLDSLTTQLSAVEAKVDEKPDLGGVFVASVAAGGFVQAVPHIWKAVLQVGRSIQDSIASKH